MLRSALRCQYRQYIKRQLSTSPTPKPTAETPSAGSSNSNKSTTSSGNNFTRNIIISLLVASSLTISNATYKMRHDANFESDLKENYPNVYQFLNGLEKIRPW